jgi:chromosome segregation and condensation protein ScpB
VDSFLYGCSNRRETPRGVSEIISIVEALIFVADEPINVKTLSEVLDEDKETVRSGNRRTGA